MTADVGISRCFHGGVVHQPNEASASSSDHPGHKEVKSSLRRAAQSAQLLSVSSLVK